MDEGVQNMAEYDIKRLETSFLINDAFFMVKDKSLNKTNKYLNWY